MSVSDEKAYELIGGFSNPEDLAPIPGTDWIIASSMVAEESGKSGALYLIDRRHRTMRKIWPSATQKVAAQLAFTDFARPVSPENVMAHGMCLEPQINGKYRLYTVNHNERKSIEVFDVEADASGVELSWVGGISIPYPSHGNAVAVMKDGTILMTCTHPLHETQFLERIRRRERTGYLMSWQAGRGWNILEDSEASCPNGLLVDEDRETIFVANTGTHDVLRAKLDLDRSKISQFDRVDLGFAPDNLRWNADGSICAGGFAAVGDFPPHACKIDPATLRVTRFSLPPHNAQFECVSTAIVIEGELWLSVFEGDKVAVLRSGDY